MDDSCVWVWLSGYGGVQKSSSNRHISINVGSSLPVNYLPITGVFRPIFRCLAFFLLSHGCHVCRHKILTKCVLNTIPHSWLVPLENNSRTLCIWYPCSKFRILSFSVCWPTSVLALVKGAGDLEVWRQHLKTQRAWVTEYRVSNDLIG